MKKSAFLSLSLCMMIAIQSILLPVQAATIEAIRKAGGTAAVVYSVDDVKRVFAEMEADYGRV